MKLGRLKALRPSVANLTPTLGYQPGDEKARDHQRSAGQPWRAWYKTARWYRLAQRVYLRDGYTCQRTGVLLAFKAPHPRSPVAHHKTPHHGDPVLFWDAANIETVSKEWHDGAGQRAEKGRGGGQNSARP